MPNKIEFKASSKKYGAAYGPTARQAGAAFFAKFPSARKCDIVQGETEELPHGTFFVVKIDGLTKKSAWPTYYEDVAKKTLDTLSDEVPPV